MSAVTRQVVGEYLETLLWSGADEDGNPLDQTVDLSDLPEALWTEAQEDLQGFADYCLEVIGHDPFEVFEAGEVACNFCLSRNGHGAGFFDGSWLIGERELNQELQACAQTFSTHGLAAFENDGKWEVYSHG
mgnify:CR=1 FL=1